MGASKEDTFYIAFGNFYCELLIFFFPYRDFPNFIFLLFLFWGGMRSLFLFDHNLLAIEKHVGMFQLWLEVGETKAYFEKKLAEDFP